MTFVYIVSICTTGFLHPIYILFVYTVLHGFVYLGYVSDGSVPIVVTVVDIVTVILVLVSASVYI